ATVSGITLTKQADGLIDIACRRDTVRIQNDTMDESVREDVLISEEKKTQRSIWWKVFFIVLLMGIFIKWRCL
ncbi:MAG: hypothetical protein ACRCX5_14840, partial [Bacteroidales bacterium]